MRWQNNSSYDLGRFGFKEDMFSLAILIGIYSYLIFALGVTGFLYKQTIVFTTLAFLLFVFLYLRKKTVNFIQHFKALKSIQPRFFKKLIIKNKLIALLILLIALQIVVNLAGVLGPELSFDALWYHLTLPKIYITKHLIEYIPGGLLYYSAMPKLMEMIYVSLLPFGGDTLAKLVHFSFGILTVLALYKLSRKFFNRELSIVSIVIFYSNLVVGWESITSYVDLSRTFFEIMALWGFINWWDKKENKWFIESAVMLGLAIATKLLALGTLFIFTLLITYRIIRGKNKNWKKLITDLLIYWSFSCIIPLPWFVFSFLNTGNPIYPFFTNIYHINFDLVKLVNPLYFIKTLWLLFTHSADPISPVYLIFLPLVPVFWKRFSEKIKVIAFYSFLAIFTWYITPRTGGGRFILPYLPAFSLIVAAIIKETKKKRLLQPFSILLVVFISFTSIFYRGVANAKYIPVIMGRETKKQFLTSHLNFNFGDFYDTDGYFKSHIKPADRVLLYGFHNLYYADFPFIDSSWVEKGNEFNFVATQDTELPRRFSFWNLIHKNLKTHVNLYSTGGQKWVY